MSKKIELTIPEPCHENWDMMTASDKGRFCASCQKQVIDFSTMSDREIAIFFKKPSTGSVCGRFMNDQLNREIVAPKKRIPWLKYFFQVAIPTFLLTTRISAQGEVKVKSTEQCERPLKDTRIRMGGVGRRTLPSELLIQKPILIGGRVIDVEGKAIPNANISYTASNDKTVSDSNGRFFMVVPSIEVNKAKLVASCVGYNVSEITVSHDSTKFIANIVLKPVSNRLTGEIVVTAGLIVRRTPVTKKPTIPLITQRIMDSAYKFFKLAPNPVHAGNEITMEWKQTEEGYYKLAMMDQSGKIIQQREVWIDAEAKLLNLEIPYVPAGIYILQLINKKSGKAYSEKLVVQ